MIQIDKFVVHCSATRPNQDIGAKEIREWHQKRGWRDIGYHKVIRRNGNLEEGRPESEPGAHVRGHNERSLGICLIGGIDENGAPQANFTYRQYTILKRLYGAYSALYPDAEWFGHYQLDKSKACPCFDVREFLEIK